MALRLNSLKTRTAVTISAVIVVLLVANAVYLIVTKQRELRLEIEENALLFARLSRAPICAGYDTYHNSGIYKFRELMRDYLHLNSDVTRIQIAHVNGRILFDSSRLDEPDLGAGLAESIRDPERLDAVKRLEPAVLRGRGPHGEELLEIVAPYLEEWGRHSLSVIYHVSYRNLAPNIRRLVYATGGLTLLSIVAAVIVAVALTSRITRPIEELTAGAQDIAEGHFDRRLSLRSNDEIQILAETFNHMAARLKENVEQLEESNRKLALLNEELKELDRMKSDLLANVSHELRTPLTAIKGYTDYILEGKLGATTEKQEKGLVVVQRNLDRLSRSIGALLDFSRMDVGRISLNIQPFGLTQLVDQIATSLRSELEKKQLVLRAEIDPVLPPVIGDREKVSQVLENLVINAIKFTPQGGRITIAAARAADADRPTAAIRVADTGIGIPRPHLGRIFNRFHQVDGSTTRRFGGVGLGLAIVKSILDAHGSTILVESEEGRGTVFRFGLPLLEHASQPSRSVVRAAESRVLLVGPDQDAPRNLGASLEAEGFSVLRAATVDQGREVASRERPEAVIVADVSLNGDGDAQGLRRLREAAGTAPLLVVAPPGSLPSDRSLGIDEFMDQPEERGHLLARLRELMAARPPGAPARTGPPA
jgi:signal transduction histidine kinase/CheY-like chemotaxis protein